jgi:hypothetical protein
MHKLALQEGTIAQLNGHLLSDEDLRKAVRGSVLLGGCRVDAGEPIYNRPRLEEGRVPRR